MHLQIYRISVQGDEDDNDEATLTKGQVAAPPAQALVAPTLSDITRALTLMQQNFESFRGEVRSRLNSIDMRLDVLAGFP